MFAAVLHQYPKLHGPALGLATLGNTPGGLTSYALGWLLPKVPTEPRMQARLEFVRRFGSPTVALAWLPVVGDALCVAAGWLRLNWLPVTLYMAADKFGRYWLIASAMV